MLITLTSFLAIGFVGSDAADRGSCCREPQQVVRLPSARITSALRISAAPPAAISGWREGKFPPWSMTGACERFREFRQALWRLPRCAPRGRR